MTHPPNTLDFGIAEIRKTFLDFFAATVHVVVPTSLRVPGKDPTLIFTNPGMVQLKAVFLDSDKRRKVRAGLLARGRLAQRPLKRRLFRALGYLLRNDG